MGQRDEKYYALEEYKMGYGLIKAAAKEYWQRFQIFFAVNSGLLAAMKLVPGQEQVGAGIAFFGAILCWIWFFVSGKMSAYELYWNRGLDRPGKVLGYTLLSERRYNDFRRGKYRSIEERNSRTHRILRWFFRNVKTSLCMLLIPCFMFLLWVWIGYPLWERVFFPNC